MAVDPPVPGPPPPPAPNPPTPTPPGPGASRDEWRAWRRQAREHDHGQWMGGWYGPWGSGGGAWGWFWGAALVLIGAYYLLTNLGLLKLKSDVLWPALLILFGVVMLLRRATSRR